jgi:RimJ/RimL family protein N-acetyltransferase
MTFSLLELSNPALESLAASRVPEGLEDRADPESMPPPFVASRSLAIAAAGHPAPWATTFLIVNDEDKQIIGGCGFKTIPLNGRVEVGYGVSPARQGNGAATAALKLLLHKAFEAGATEVLAEVTPTNLASTRVVKKLGFVQIGDRVDNDNEQVIQWVKRSEA